jgi:hypothetical protein
MLCVVRISWVAESFQIGADRFLEPGGLGELGVEFRDKARHLFFEGVAIVFDFLGTDVAAGREDVPVGRDLSRRS